MSTGSILLVDDETKILNALAQALREDRHEVVATTSAREAQRLLSQRMFDLLVVDNLMPELTGLDLIRELHASGAADRPQIVMMTAHATVESAIEAMKLGAFDYLQKPFEVDELLVVASRALDHQRLRTEHRYLISERDAEYNHYGLVGRSRRMEEVIRTAEVVAKSRSTVLIMGETGTGKEMVARAIHYHSAQREMPLIKVNCAAIPDTLLESELFGHVRGAFTGATTSKRGKFALADGGTIFLDEIGTMSPTLQSKLLRVIQEREFESLGSERTQKVDVRVIAATNRDLQQMVADGRFQEDLYYRLHVIPDSHSTVARTARGHPGTRRTLHPEARAARREAHRRHRAWRDAGASGLGLAGQRSRAREHHGTRGRAVADRDHRARRRAHPERQQHAAGRPPVTQPPAESRLDRTRDCAAGARELGRREKGCRRGDGPDPASAQLLPREAPIELAPLRLRALTRRVTRFVNRKHTRRLKRLEACAMH